MFCQAPMLQLRWRLLVLSAVLMLPVDAVKRARTSDLQQQMVTGLPEQPPELPEQVLTHAQTLTLSIVKTGRGRNHYILPAPLSVGTPLVVYATGFTDGFFRVFLGARGYFVPSVWQGKGGAANNIMQVVVGRNSAQLVPLPEDKGFTGLEPFWFEVRLEQDDHGKKNLEIWVNGWFKAFSMPSGEDIILQDFALSSNLEAESVYLVKRQTGTISWGEGKTNWFEDLWNPIETCWNTVVRNPMPYLWFMAVNAMSILLLITPFLVLSWCRNGRRDMEVKSIALFCSGCGVKIEGFTGEDYAVFVVSDSDPVGKYKNMESVWRKFGADVQTGHRVLCNVCTKNLEHGKTLSHKRPSFRLNDTVMASRMQVKAEPIDPDAYFDTGLGEIMGHTWGIDDSS